ncbi:MAG TPA: DUF2721 domain-containing protein [Ramlibacter sp.]|nr:DUF2721 domain-containing protein [Ramlibacter sp.]
MAIPTDPGAVTHGIQLAIAPVFLLTAVSGMIAAVAGRLARIIDRARKVEEKALASTDAAVLERARRELTELRQRGRLANGCIALLTSCAFLIGLTIIVLFLGETTSFQANRLAVGSFMSGVLCFLLALLCFLAETVMATRILDFSVLSVPPPSAAAADDGASRSVPTGPGSAGT